MTPLTDTIQQHIAYNYWAHRRIWTCVMMLTDEQFNRPLDYSVGAISDQIVHTMWAEDVWFSRILDGSPPTYTGADFVDRAAIRASWDALETTVRQTVAGMDDDDLLRVIRYQNSKGHEFQQTVLQIILHLVNHGTDHRAQTLAMMHTLGAETISQDLIYYFRES